MKAEDFPAVLLKIIFAKGGMGWVGNDLSPSVLEKPIQIQIYEPIPEKPGYLRHVRNRTIGEIYDELRERLSNDGLLPDEYFDISYSCEKKPWERDKDEFPRCRRIACYAVTGSNEGHYIHVDAIQSITQNIIPVFIGKTFQGIDFALNVVKACTIHLGA